MSALMRKKLIEEVGGLRSFGCYLAEDFFLAKSFMDRGWKLRISHQPAWQNPGSCEITAFQARITRYASAMILNAANSDDDFSHFFFNFSWAKLRIAMVPAMILLEPISECMLLGALAAWAANWLFGWDPLVLYLVHVLLWFLLDSLLLSIVQVIIDIQVFSFPNSSPYNYCHLLNRIDIGYVDIWKMFAAIDLNHVSSCISYCSNGTVSRPDDSYLFFSHCRMAVCLSTNSNSCWGGCCASAALRSCS